MTEKRSSRKLKENHSFQNPGKRKPKDNYIFQSSGNRKSKIENLAIQDSRVLAIESLRKIIALRVPTAENLKKIFAFDSLR